VRYCVQYSDQSVAKDGPLMALGTIAGHAVTQGLGSEIGVYWPPRRWRGCSIQKKTMSKVFVSFYFDNAQGLKSLLVGQALNPDSPFQVVDKSLKESALERHWKDKARRAIRLGDLVLVVLGKQTYRAPGVLWEVKMARKEAKPVVLLSVYAMHSIGACPVQVRSSCGHSQIIFTKCCKALTEEYVI
jgi:hypothetical protein